MSHRQSALETYSICGERYRRAYVENEPTNESAASLMGTAVHVAQAAVASHMRADGEVVTPIYAGRLAHDHFQWLVEQDRESPDPIPWSSKEVINERAKEAEAMAAALAAESPEIWATYGKPVMVEQHFEGAEWQGHSYEGTLDCATDQLVILDWKTARRDWPRSRKDKKLQPLVYSIGHEHLTQKWPVGFVFVVVARTKEIKVRYHEVEPSIAKLKFLAEQTAAIERAITYGVYPYNPSHELCSPDWCPFWNTCPASVLKDAA